MYRTVIVDLSRGESIGDSLNLLAAEGWSVHTVLKTDDTVFEALLERKSAVTSATMAQPPRPAPQRG